MTIGTRSNPYNCRCNALTAEPCPRRIQGLMVLKVLLQGTPLMAGQRYLFDNRTEQLRKTVKLLYS